MPAPTVHDLPPAPPGRTGWPWIGTPDPLPPAQPDGSPWPRISIVTPSYNQADYLEEAIRSMLLQGYPALETIIIDGGSTDGSQAIIERYAPWLTYWTSEPDQGQAHAINKGFAQATGDWFGWLNSDDCYAPSALRHLMTCANQEQATLVTGASVRFRDGETSTPTRIQPTPDALQPANIRRKQGFDQPACIWRRELFEQAGPLEKTYRYVFDWAFFIRAIPLAQPAISQDTIACYRVHPNHKTGSGGADRWSEIYHIYEHHLDGDDRAAFRRVRPWLNAIRWLAVMSRSYGWFGLYYGWRGVLGLVRRLVIDREPRLHPAISALLELPYAAPQRARTQTQGHAADGSPAAALAAFDNTQGSKWTSR
ncbi:MAG: glycosyltransferase [Anaerolineae bacterium]|nr:glycosyltransferase [Anaerolineae bacterium]